MKEEEVKSYKWVKLQQNPPKNAVLYVFDPRTRDVELFVTDKNGVPKPVTSRLDISKYVSLSPDNAVTIEDNRIFVKKYVEGDEYIEIVEGDKKNELKLNITKVIQDVLDALVDSLGDKNYEHDQANSSSIWTINHNLNKKPSVTIIDTANTVVEGKVIINDENTITIEFNFPFSGKAILN